MNKKDEIFNKALELFVSYGYENVGVKKIADSSGVKKPTLYHYFSSKKGLLTAILEFYIDPFVKELNEIAEYKGDIERILKDITIKYFNFVKSTGGFYRLLLSLILSSEHSEARKTVEPYALMLFSFFDGIFKMIEKDHENMKGHSLRYAMSFQGMIHSYISTYYYGYVDLTDKTASTGSHQFIHGIF